MFTRIKLASFALLALAACSATPGPSSEQPFERSTRTGQSLSYAEPCTPSACDALPVPAIGCGDGGDPVVSCAPGNDGACHVDVKCGGAPGSSPPSGSSGGNVSYSECPASACGPLPAIGCAPGYTLGESCGSENSAACRWTTTCSPPPSDTPCAPEACGPVPALAEVCKDGSTGKLDCMKVGSKCTWQSKCP